MTSETIPFWLSFILLPLPFYSNSTFFSILQTIPNYNDIQITQGAVFNADVPAFSSTDLENNSLRYSSTEYSLSKNGIALTPNVNLTGDVATAAYFMVETISDNIEHGFVRGQGYRQLGSFAKVSAFPLDDDYVFEGWYDGNGVKKSSDCLRLLHKLAS